MRRSAGTRLPGYQLLQPLGEGATGVVYQARQDSTGQLVAIKLIRMAPVASGTGRERLLARFARETQLCAQLHHPHIVSLLDKGETAEGDLYAVFEYVPGETLRDWVQRQSCLDPVLACELLGQVLDALAAAHAQGIVHRDLKPLNIMVMRSGAQPHAMVLDFGIGTLVDEAHAGSALTLTTETVGTPRYCAPEQLRGEPPTVKSDLYAWGLILLECLTGVPAIRGQTLAQIYHEHLSPSEIALPPALLRHPLGELLRRVLSKQPRARGETAELALRFAQLQVHNLVGVLQPPQACAGEDGLDATVAAVAPLVERRQLTMLCYSLELQSLNGQAPDPDLVEELLHDQLVQCQDTCSAHAAYPAGELGPARLLYFGYPQADDAAARHAATAALALVKQVAQRSERLEKRDGLRLTVRAALHTGVVTAYPGRVPAGLPATQVVRMEQDAAQGSIVVSADARRLLERHFVIEPSAGAGPGRLRGVREEGATGMPCVGRVREQAALHALWQGARQGTGGALVLQGEAGMGKSRLVQQLCARVADDGGTAWVLSCLPEQRNAALHPFLRWLSRDLGLDHAPDTGHVHRQLGQALEALGQAELLPVVCSWLGLPLPEPQAVLPHAPQRQRQIMLDTLARLLQQRAAGPWLLVLEDVHWIDPTSRELVARLHAAGSPLALLVTTRPAGQEFAPDWPVLALQGLEPDDARDLLRAVWPPTRPLDDAELQRLMARAEGNPLYLTELARARQDLPRPALGETTIPITLRDVLRQALDRLGPARETAQWAAVLGREFDPGLLAAVSLRDEASLHGDLQQMQLADLIQPPSAVGGYLFRHALLRDAAYDAMPGAVREQAHARVAQVLQWQQPQAHGLLARHHAAAAQHAQAVAHGTRAAGQALGRALHDEALGWAESVEGWIGHLPADQRSAALLDLRLITTQALMSKYGWADARVRAEAEQSSHLLAEVDDAPRAGAVLWALATYHHVASDRARVRELVDQLIALARRSDSAALLRAAHTLQGVAHWIDGRYPQAAAALARVQTLPRAEGDEDAARFGLDCRCWSLAALAHVRWFTEGDPAAALALADEAVAAAEALGHMPTLGLALMYQAFLHQHGQDRAAAAQVCTRLLELSRRYGLPAVEGYAALVDGWVRGDATLMTHILGALHGMGCLLGSTYLGSLLAEVLLRAGQPQAALAQLADGLALAERIAEPYYRPELLRLQARALQACGNDSGWQTQAQASLAEAARQARACGIALRYDLPA